MPSIIPLTNPNNNVNEIDKGIRIYELYPYGKSSFTEYDDAVTDIISLLVSFGCLIDRSNQKIRPVQILVLCSHGKSSFTEYDDDGVSEEYKRGKGVTTNIESDFEAAFVSFTFFFPTCAVTFFGREVTLILNSVTFSFTKPIKSPFAG